jgi:hypothetical protein
MLSTCRQHHATLLPVADWDCLFFSFPKLRSAMPIGISYVVKHSAFGLFAEIWIPDIALQDVQKTITDTSAESGSAD